MGNTIKIDQLAAEIMKGLTEYADRYSECRSKGYWKICKELDNQNHKRDIKFS